MLKERHRKLYYTTIALFVIYLLFLVWVILFKMEFSINQIGRVRTYNLIPFYYEQDHNVRFHFTEVRDNILVFIPMGIYLSLLFPKQSFWRRASIIFACSLALECSQYGLAVGRFDITDLITNTAGGLVGVGICLIGYTLFREKANVEKMVAILVDFVTICVVGLMLLMLSLN